MSRIISSAMINSINEPATANEFTSTLKSSSIRLPPKRNISRSTVEISVALSGFTSNFFCLNDRITGIEPIISITAKSVIVVLNVSFKEKPLKKSIINFVLLILAANIFILYLYQSIKLLFLYTYFASFTTKWNNPMTKALFHKADLTK